MLLARNSDNVRRVPAARTLRMVGMKRSPGDRREEVLDEPGLIESIAVDRHLNSRRIRDGQGGIDDGWGRAPVLVNFESGRSTPKLLPQGLM